VVHVVVCPALVYCLSCAHAPLSPPTHLLVGTHITVRRIKRDAREGVPDALRSAQMIWPRFGNSKEVSLAVLRDDDAEDKEDRIGHKVDNDGDPDARPEGFAAIYFQRPLKCTDIWRHFIPL